TSGAPHSWFIGFVEGNQTVYAIAVILENAGEGSRAAAAAFQQIGQATLSIIDDDPNTINTND
ncbi:MAG: penicillin-binding transpeptidase domain-containing protein, partial [Candidatus Promineifilaceae bacterium]